MTGLYGETYLIVVDGTIYRLKEAPDDYLLDNHLLGTYYPLEMTGKL